jgi:TonB-dependent starch-binding outer membrane protein SusC
MKKKSMNTFLQCRKVKKWFLMMKLTMLLFLAGLMQVSATVYSQATKFNFRAENKQVVEVLKEIEESSDFRFFYSREQVDVERKVTVRANGATVEQILDELFAGQGISYKVMDDNLVLLSPDENITKMEFVVSQQQNSVSGKVTDSNNQPLPGVTIVVKGTTKGTVTNADGNYSITNIPDDAILQFSFVGMLTQEVVVGNQNVINIVLEEVTVGIEEVVAIGYGTMKKSDLTGSITSIKGAELVRTPILSVQQGLQGQIAGVQVLQTSGQPGAAARVRIRGTNSINGGSQPIYVIDGFPYYYINPASGIGLSSGGFDPMSMINPNDIESVDVLKDASATAIYGSRASNGVIIITTKKGKMSKSEVTLNASYGIQSVARKIDLLNAQEYAIFQNEAFQLRGLQQRYSQTDIDNYGIHGGTDWQDEIFRTAPIQNYILSLSGKNENTSYYFSAGYTSQDGIIINSGYERASFRINLDHKVNDKLTFSTNLSYSQANSALMLTNTTGSASGGVVFRVLNEDPTKPVYKENGSFNYDRHGLFWGGNAVADAMLIDSDEIVDRVLCGFSGKWQITSNLTGLALFGIDATYSEDRFFQPSELTRSGGRSYASFAKVKNFTWLNEYTLTYQKVFNSVHNFSLMVGSGVQAHNHNNLVGQTADLSIEQLKYYALGVGTNPSRPGSYFYDWSFASFFSRINYILKDKYLFTFSGRYDGSSRFGTDNKWGFFPSGAFAWKMSEENFIKDLNIFSNLKTRTSYGTTGNSEIGLYNTQQLISQANYSFGNQVVSGYGPNPTNLPNPSLGWESTSQFNVGLDVGFIDNKINVNFDYYRKLTSDLLFNSTVPPSSGRSQSQKNMGELENKGFELSINTINLSKSDFNWTSSINISRNKNKVLDLEGVDKIIFPSSSGGAWVNNYDPSALVVGQPIGIFYGYLNDGIVQLGQENSVPKVQGLPNPFPGWHNYKDMNGDNLITPEDRTIIGDPYPKFTAGFSNKLSYKDFELNFLLNGAFGFDIFSHSKAEMMQGRGERNIHKDLYLNFWTENNPTNKYTKNGLKDTQSIVFSRNPMSYWVEHTSFVRIQNVTFAYNLPQNLLNRMKISNAKVYLSGDNLYCFTNYKYGYDPELSKFGGDNIRVNQDQDTYPRPKSVSFGISLGF